MVGQLANQVDRTCSSSNSLSLSGTQNNDLGAALQTSLAKVTTCTLSKAKYKYQKKGVSYPDYKKLASDVV